MRNLPNSFTALLDMPFRWPRMGDRLLRKTKDWQSGVSFTGDALSRHVHIWDGYMSAAEAIVEDCRRNAHERHFMIYPALFLYRHATELAMKWILTRYGHHSPEKLISHNLWELWKLCRPVIESAGSTDEATDIVASIIKQMHDLDSSALAFRYGSDTNAKTLELPDGLYDIENIRDVMTGVGGYFNGADAMLSELVGIAP